MLVQYTELIIKIINFFLCLKCPNPHFISADRLARDPCETVDLQGECSHVIILDILVPVVMECDFYYYTYRFN